MIWKLSKWNAAFAGKGNLVPMTDEEIVKAVKYLRSNYYPKPADCPEQECSCYRPACMLNICHIAVRMCGDF